MLLSIFAIIAFPVHVQASVSPEVGFIFNSFLFVICGLLVMFMAAGFAMLESGMVRSKNVSTICLKNIALFAVAGILYYLVGYNLMYDGVDGGFIGSFSSWSHNTSVSDLDFTETTYSAGSDWFFQMVFVATAASIVSGTLAERIKLSSFLVFMVILTGLIYPIQGAWSWGGGWLSEKGFSDFAGSSIVHSVGGWAALTGAIFLGARTGKYDKNGKVIPILGSSMPLATLGTFILWFGWFGFNGGSQLALGSAADVNAISTIFINTNMAAAGGVVVALIATRLFYGKIDLTMVLNGAIGGLVSITAEPLTPSIGMATLIGGIGGLLIVLTVPLLDKLKIDDVVGAIPAHLVCGIWGTLAVPLTNTGANFSSQILGITAIGGFVIITSTITWFIITKTIGIRVSKSEESLGMDKAELGMEAYPEFTN